MAVAKRSPIRGYNHNIRYRGLVFHVQTEDSGVDNPHVFTHVFHGGVILNTRKLTYDGESAEDVVKSLMQAQHRALLKALKHGELDEKIDAYLGGNPELEPAGGVLSPDTPLVESQTPGEVNASISAAFDAIRGDEAVPDAVDIAATEVYSKPDSDRISVTAPTMLQNDLLRAAQASAPAQTSPPAQASPPPVPAKRPAARPPPIPAPVKPAARPRSGTQRSSGVVVSRPAVIVSAPPKVVGKQPGRPSRARQAREDKSSDGSLFGQGLISEKSLDEVILAYLSDDASDE